MVNSIKLTLLTFVLVIIKMGSLGLDSNSWSGWLEGTISSDRLKNLQLLIQNLCFKVLTRVFLLLVICRVVMIHHCIDALIYIPTI